MSSCKIKYLLNRYKCFRSQRKAFLNYNKIINVSYCLKYLNM